MTRTLPAWGVGLWDCGPTSPRPHIPPPFRRDMQTVPRAPASHQQPVPRRLPMFSRIRSLGLAATCAALFASPALAKGPPWISIELPANPYDQTMRGAFLLVHAFHHGKSMGYIVTGTAEGIVNGARQSVTLEFTETSRDGVHALRRTWPTEGTWTLVIKANQGPGDLATAVVELGPDGEVAAVSGPSMHRVCGAITAPGSLETNH